MPPNSVHWLRKAEACEVANPDLDRAPGPRNWALVARIRFGPLERRLGFWGWIARDPGESQF